jgi:hypothetical protein
MHLPLKNEAARPLAMNSRSSRKSSITSLTNSIANDLKVDDCIRLVGSMDYNVACIEL